MPKKLAIALLSALLTACSTTRFLPEGESLLNKVKIEGAPKNVSREMLNQQVRQQPNARWFALLPLPLYTYSLAGRDSARWINRMLWRLGDPPVVYSSESTHTSCQALQQALRAQGYLHAEAKADTATKGRKTTMTYRLTPHEQYTLGEITRQISDSSIAALLMPHPSSLIKGMPLTTTTLDAERTRLTNILTNHGYFRFHKEFISYQADTMPGSTIANLTLRIKPYEQRGKADTLHTVYTIGPITYEGSTLRPKVLAESTHLITGQPYSAKALTDTYQHFGRLQAIRSTHIELTPLNQSDTLACHVRLQPQKTNSISFQPEGTNTAGDLGAAATLTYQNRNIFHGSETFSFQLRGAYEAIKGLEGYQNQNFVEWSAETSLQFPRILAPFIATSFLQRMNATSELKLLYDLQNRPEFHRRLLSATWRYRWNTPNGKHRYQADLLDLNYVFMPWLAPTFRHDYLENDLNHNAILRYNYEDLFIMKMGFGYAFHTPQFALKANIETAGNMLALCSQIGKNDKDEQGHHRIFNIAYAQYVKADIDLTQSIHLDQNNQIVLHLGLGIAYPYGNSTVLPFEKRYFAGGANSVRGWSVRGLGPGKYKEKDGRINFINQTGDLKLDLNTEWRTKLFWKFSAALFIDAGNIWTIRNYKEQPGGQFSFTHFYQQIAVAYGAGLRLNFDYFILRFDLGMKAINPAFETEDAQHYPLLHPNFKHDHAFHFAVGLPF